MDAAVTQVVVRTLEQAALLGASVSASSPWRVRCLVARTLAAVPGFLALSLLGSTVGITARAVAESYPHAVLAGIVRAFAGWALTLIAMCALSAPAIIISSFLAAVVRIGARRLLGASGLTSCASDGAPARQQLFGIVAPGITALAVLAWQVHVAFQYGKW